LPNVQYEFCGFVIIENTTDTRMFMSQLEQQFNPYRDIIRSLRENRQQLSYAWRILNNGVCDGCALGTSGLRDWTMPGIHLCWIRLNLLHLNTMPALDSNLLKDITTLREHSEKQLRILGRLSSPMIRRKGEKGFQSITWDEALSIIAERIRPTEPSRLAFYLTSRGTVNETYYVAQKVARFLGTNHIDNSARICHAPSPVGLKQALGYAASICSYKDWIGTDLLVFIGSNAANNHPVALKYVQLAKKQGTKVVVINPVREPGFKKTWIPSSVSSAVFGTPITDAFFQINVGGDIAFINGVLKHLIENNWIDQTFIQENTQNWDDLVQKIKAQSFDELEQNSGASKESMLEFARLYAEAKTAIFAWTMGITMHRFGVQNIRAIINLALARGMVGHPKTGLMALRGHSGVQGGAEVGAIPNQFPGGTPINEESAEQLQSLWDFEVPTWKGYFAPEMIEAAHRNEMDVFYCGGSNLFNVLPDSHFVKQSLARIPLRIHHDIVINPQMFVEPADTVILLPATTRYEMAGGNTETSTERRIIFNPEIPGQRIPEARDEWRVLMDIAKRVKPDKAALIDFTSTSQIRSEIAKAVPFYQGIEQLTQKGDNFQWGGERLGENHVFKTPDGKAHFAPLDLPQRNIPNGMFQLITRRGKQFNSIVFGNKDMFMGGQRDNVLMSSHDMQRLNLREGDKICLRSKIGQFCGRVRQGDLQQGVVIMYWPEANILIQHGIVDPQCGMPAYSGEMVQVMTEETK
jgi:molybdopterin-dependent oxidoreductase alpha subunit